MNKNRIGKTIGFLVTGCLFFIPLIFLGEIVKSITKDKVELITKIGKGVLITIGIIFLAVGIYNLIMMFVEEEEGN